MDDNEQETRELQEELSKLRSLSEHAGFKYLLEIATQQIESRTSGIILSPLAKMDDVLGQEYAKGEIAGITLFKELVGVRITDLLETIEERLKPTEDEENVQNQ